MNFWVFRMGHTVISVHTGTAPTDPQWNVYIDELKKTSDEVGFAAIRGISFTDGGAPTSAQRERLNVFMKGRSAPASVVSGNPVVRGVVTALGWFNPKIRVFAPSRVHDALVHIGFASSDISMLCNQLQPMLDSVEAARRAVEVLRR